MTSTSTSGIKSGRELARRLDRGASTVRRYLADPRWPFGDKPPWQTGDLEAMRAWMQSLSPDPGAPLATPRHDAITARARQIQVTKAEAQTTVAEERAASLRLERLARQGKLVDRAEIERRQGASNASLRVGLQRAARALRTRLADERDPRACEAILTRAFKAICDHAFGKATEPEGAPSASLNEGATRCE